ncbi:hypothetical protein EGT74_00960 [Chitinophaga lutea]|uniref:Uncharacterized protein n=1 Tax=Chitinophaga lutea TaxID=2488634 RepID=A0A3N4PZ37_9BACT|nr:hypothetical protein [Chitinophaga lutea]RPE12159.1 hypothetical protein EGT74_00960 [Chitinophaga lutea]
MAREPFAARLTNIWIGGFFFWMLKGFSGKFADELAAEKERRNLRTGYLLSLIALILLFYALLHK